MSKKVKMYTKKLLHRAKQKEEEQERVHKAEEKEYRKRLRDGSRVNEMMRGCGGN